MKEVFIFDDLLPEKRNIYKQNRDEYFMRKEVLLAGLLIVITTVIYALLFNNASISGEVFYESDIQNPSVGCSWTQSGSGNYSYTGPGFVQRADLKQVDGSVLNLTVGFVGGQVVTLRTSGRNAYVGFKTGLSNEYKEIVFVHDNSDSSSSAALGLNDSAGKKIYVNEGERAGINEYLLINSGDYGRIIRLIVVPSGALTSTSYIRFEDVMTGEWIFSGDGLTVGTTGTASTNLNGQPYYFHVANSTTTPTVSVTWGEGSAPNDAGSSVESNVKIKLGENIWLILNDINGLPTTTLPSITVTNGSDEIVLNIESNLTSAAKQMEISDIVYSVGSVGKNIEIACPDVCHTNWVNYNTSCKSNDMIDSYFVDSSACNSTSSMPSNASMSCDYDGNGIRGNKSTVSTSGFSDMTIRINSSLMSLSSNYTETGVRKVEILDSNVSLVEFDWNFSSQLDLYGVRVEKESSSANKGYIIVSGLAVSKTVYISKINESSDGICIEDGSISSINEISAGCNASGEIQLECPGTSGRYSCSIEGDKFKVSGLLHSAVREFIETSQADSECTPSWNCTSFGTCVDGVQIRTCADENDCGITAGKPSLNQTCVSQPSECTPSWNCTSWSPSKCPDSKEQTRTCTDKNSCGTSTGKPSLTKTCTPSSPKWLIWVIVAVLSIAALAIIIVLLRMVLGKSSHQQTAA